MTLTVSAPVYGVTVASGGPTSAIEVTQSAAPLALEVTMAPVGVSVASVGLQGPIGPTGATGAKGEPGTSADALEVPAGEDVGGHRPISVIGGAAYHTDPDDADSAAACVGISLNAAALGDTVRIVVAGYMTEPSWGWMDGPIWVGAGGLLTQSPPAVAAVIQIGVATGPQSLVVTPRFAVFGG